MKLYSVNGTYGSLSTPCTVFVAEDYSGRATWYCVEGSQNVNYTHDLIEDGINVEWLSDSDTFTASKPINSLEDLEAAIEA